MNVWRPIDWLARQIYKRWTPIYQMRSGVLMVLVSVVVIGYGAFTSEPPLIYQMSAFALLFAGLGLLVTAVLAIESSDTSEDVDFLVDKNKDD